MMLSPSMTHQAAARSIYTACRVEGVPLVAGERAGAAARGARREGGGGGGGGREAVAPRAIDEQWLRAKLDLEGRWLRNALREWLGLLARVVAADSGDLVIW